MKQTIAGYYPNYVQHCNNKMLSNHVHNNNRLSKQKKYAIKNNQIMSLDGSKFFKKIIKFDYNLANRSIFWETW